MALGVISYPNGIPQENSTTVVDHSHRAVIERVQ